MADTSVFQRLKRLFSTQAVVRNIGGKKLKVSDTAQTQAYGTRNIIDRYRRVYNAGQYGYSAQSNYDTYSSFQQARLQLFRDYDLMDHDPIIASVLDIYADESTVKNEFGEMISIKSDNDEIQNILSNLFYDILNIEFNLWPWARNMCKYGDFFLYLILDPEHGISNVIPLSVYETGRIEGDEETMNPFSVKFKVDTQYSFLPKKEFDNYEVAHFRLLSDSNFMPYGKSMIEGGRRIHKQLRLMEDAMLIHRITRAPDKRVFKVDVGNIPPAEIDNYMERIINQVKRQPLVDQNTGEYNMKFNMQNILEDFYLPVRGKDSGTEINNLSGLTFNAIEDVDYLLKKLMAAFKVPKSFIGYEEDICVVPETLIPVLDGTEKTVEELITDYESGIKNYVYSIDEETHNIVPGEIEWAGWTRQNATLVRVYLDNDEYIDCTPDHNFMTRSGNWVEAQNLTEKQSLMPLYLGRSTDPRIKDYTTVYHPSTGEYEMVHRMVTRECGIDVSEKVRHHKDLNKWNNNPENLDCSMTFMEHRRFHSTILNESVAMKHYRESDVFIENQKINGKLGGMKSAQHLGEWAATHTPWNKGNLSGDFITCVCGNEFYTTQQQQYCSHNCWGEDNRGEMYNTKYNKISLKTLLKFANECTSFKDLEGKIDVDRNTLNRIFDFNDIDKAEFIVNYMPLALQNTRFMSNYPNIKNHKVNRIEFLDETKNTCDIRVKQYHNFATSAGVIIHNSGKATLAAQDVRFARTIERIQRIMVSELNKIAIIHLYILGFKDEELVNFSLSLTNPSMVYELEKISLWKEKSSLADQLVAGRFMSREWIYQNIFELSDEDVIIEQDKILDDAKFEGTIQKVTQDTINPPQPEMGGEEPPMEESAEDTDLYDAEQSLADVQKLTKSKKKMGRPPEGHKYGSDKDKLGRDPLGYKEILAAMDVLPKNKKNGKSFVHPGLKESLKGLDGFIDTLDPKILKD